MKTCCLALLFLGSSFAHADEAIMPDSKPKLSEVTGIDEAAAKSLLALMETGDREKLKQKMDELVRQNKTELVALALYDTSDSVKIVAAQAISSSKKKAIALMVLDASKYLEFGFIGGTETEGRRKRAKATFDQTLSTMTGVAVVESWTPEEKNKAFKDAIEKLPE